MKELIKRVKNLKNWSLLINGGKDVKSARPEVPGPVT